MLERHGRQRERLFALEGQRTQRVERPSRTPLLTTPLGPRPHVYKTAGKMFALCGHLDARR